MCYLLLFPCCFYICSLCLIFVNLINMCLGVFYFGNLMRRVDIGKDSDAGRDWGQEEKGTIEDETAGWHHWLNGRESEWTLGVGDGQGGLACCNSWGCKESDTTEWLNWTKLECFALGLSCVWLSGFLGLGWLFPSPFWGSFLLLSPKYFLMAFLFVFFFWDSYD